MWILKSINNSCAFGRDADGKDVIVFGKGIGFRKAPYELTDLSRVSRTFYGVKPSQAGIVADVPEETVLVAADIVGLARAELGVKLSPNAAFVLADHINFAITRAAQGIDLATPLANEIRHFFPREYRVGKVALNLVNDRLGTSLPDDEAANMALHIVDAEGEPGGTTSAGQATRIIADVTRIAEEELGIPVDTESADYARFVTHLRFLAERISGNVHREDGVAPMLTPLSETYPQAAAIVRHIVAYFYDQWHWECDESETLYLLVHVQRLRSSLQDA